MKIALVLLLCLALTGCETVKGMGKDAKKVGRAVKSIFTAD